MLRASLPATIQIVENISEVPPVFGDPGGLQQVVVNLVTNAAQAIDGGIGGITVSVLGISETASAPHRGRTGPKAYYDDGERFHEVDPRTLAGVTRR